MGLTDSLKMSAAPSPVDHGADYVEEKKYERPRVPQLGTQDHKEQTPTAFEPDVEMPPPRTFWQRYRTVLSLQYDQDEDMPTIAMAPRKTKNMWEYFTASIFPLKPETYVDAYERPNRCPEEHWVYPWRWPNTRRVNPKIPPPLDGKYNDYYHYQAFKYWMRMERDVYVMHLALLQEMMLRCSLKEGLNAAKNCRHLWNKYFAMSRAEEFNQSLLYMAITGNAVIRETPYPPDFIEQKRKIYDDWLYRTRMKKPGDLF